jgi:hypothetical protein
MAKMQAVFYRSVDGQERVDDFIGRLNIKRQVAIDNQIDRLNDLMDNGPPSFPAAACRQPVHPGTCPQKEQRPDTRPGHRDSVGTMGRL